MSELLELTAAQAIDAIRRGETTSEAVWDAYRGRAAADELNSYTWVARAGAPEVDMGGFRVPSPGPAPA